MGRWIGGWVDGWMGGRVDGWIDGWVGGWMNGLIYFVLLKRKYHGAFSMCVITHAILEKKRSYLAIASRSNVVDVVISPVDGLI